MGTDLSSRRAGSADGRWGEKSTEVDYSEEYDNKNVKDQGKSNSRERSRREDKDHRSREKNGKTKDCLKGRGKDVQDSGKDGISRKRERKEGIEKHGKDKTKDNGRDKYLDRDAFMEEDEAPKACKEKKGETSGRTEVSKSGIGESSKTEVKEDLVLGNTIHEVSIGKGLFGALKLLKEQGDLKDTKELDGRNMDKKRSKLVGIHDVEGPREIHIERRNEFGRDMTPKEAFRELSRIFHGKGPGKRKQEKRLKQYQDEQKKKQMASSDVLLQSVERMREAQLQLKTPYLVLSGHVKNSGGIEEIVETEMGSHCKTQKDLLHQKDLPHDLITQNILTRLPIKTLLRFKSVSKQWYSTLSSSHFAFTHFKFPRTSRIESLLIRSNNKFQFLSFENADQSDHDSQIASNNVMSLVNIEVDFDIGDEKLVLVGSCNGLVCLGSTSGCLFILWNPITRDFCKYLDFEICKLVNIGWMVTWGFGYVSVVDDYKIVRICKNMSVGSIRVDVYSIKLNKWRRIDDDPCHNFSDLKLAERLHRPGVLVNETLYWTGGLPPTLHVLQRKILSFDLALGLFDTFPHLDMSTPTRWITGDDECFDEFLCEIKGCLSKYGRLVRSGEGVITILKHPGETEQILLSMDLIGSTCKNLIGFAGSDRIFTQYYSSHKPHLGMIDLSSRPMKHTSLMTLERGSKIEIASISESLISPAAITRTPEHKDSNY